MMRELEDMESLMLVNNAAVERLNLEQQERCESRRQRNAPLSRVIAGGCRARCASEQRPPEGRGQSCLNCGMRA